MDELKQIKKITNKMIELSDRVDIKENPYKMHLLAARVRDAAYAIRKHIKEIEEGL